MKIFVITIVCIEIIAFFLRLLCLGQNKYPRLTETSAFGDCFGLLAAVLIAGWGIFLLIN